jgi:hypothetical protein
MIRSRRDGRLEDPCAVACAPMRLDRERGAECRRRATDLLAHHAGEVSLVGEAELDRELREVSFSFGEPPSTRRTRTRLR